MPNPQDLSISITFLSTLVKQTNKTYIYDKSNKAQHLKQKKVCFPIFTFCLIAMCKTMFFNRFVFIGFLAFWCMAFQSLCKYLFFNKILLDWMPIFQPLLHKSRAGKCA